MHRRQSHNLVRDAVVGERIDSIDCDVEDFEEEPHNVQHLIEKSKVVEF